MLLLCIAVLVQPERTVTERYLNLQRGESKILDQKPPHARLRGAHTGVYGFVYLIYALALLFQYMPSAQQMQSCIAAM